MVPKIDRVGLAFEFDCTAIVASSTCFNVRNSNNVTKLCNVLKRQDYQYTDGSKTLARMAQNVQNKLSGEY